MRDPTLLQRIAAIYQAARRSEDGMRCCVAPAPALQDRLRQELSDLRRNASPALGRLLGMRAPPRVGFNDGLIVPGTALPLGASPSVARAVAANRKQPLRGNVNVVVVLVEFPDRKIQTPKKHYEDLFFSKGVVATGSVREYYDEVTNGLVKIGGQVVGPFTMPRTLAAYAGNGSGIDNPTPNSRTMARDAAVAADPAVDFSKYDNDRDGFVDAFVVIHAGPGAEVSGDTGDIWSHKWVLEGQPFAADRAKVFAYLTVPEDARLGVCAHELGHLLFGFPDLYDTDGSSEGVGNWCLMGGGSWLGDGDVPAHPSAWCKCQQGWAKLTNQTANGTRSFADVKSSREVVRLWRRGASSSEYFLVEYRGKRGFDRFLPGGGLLVWHIDDTIDGNTNERHPKVGLVQADGRDDLAAGRNRGDDGDPFPGGAGNRRLAADTKPSSRSYGDLDTEVSIANLVDKGTSATAAVTVSSSKPPRRKAPAATARGGAARRRTVKAKRKVAKRARRR